MSATDRGISDHSLVEMIESCYMRLRSLGIEGRAADRCMVGMVTRASGFTAGQAIAAADRVVPSLKAERPADEPESAAQEPEPSRQA